MALQERLSVLHALLGIDAVWLLGWRLGELDTAAGKLKVAGAAVVDDEEEEVAARGISRSPCARISSPTKSGWHRLAAQRD